MPLLSQQSPFYTFDDIIEYDVFGVVDNQVVPQATNQFGIILVV